MTHGPALVRFAGSVFDVRFPVAAVAALPQLRVELLQSLRLDLRDRNVAQRWLDRALDVSAVSVDRRLLAFMDFEPGIDRVPERCLRGCAALLVDLRQEAGPDLGDLLLVARRLAEIGIFARDRVDSRVNEQVRGGRPRGTRTHNPRIKSPLLCQLS